MSELMHEVDVLEGKLQEASKQRESRLRKVCQSLPRSSAARKLWA